jgi:hypothetical protein
VGERSERGDLDHVNERVGAAPSGVSRAGSMDSGDCRNGELENEGEDTGDGVVMEEEEEEEEEEEVVGSERGDWPAENKFFSGGWMIRARSTFWTRNGVKPRHTKKWRGRRRRRAGGGGGGGGLYLHQKHLALKVKKEV